MNTENENRDYSLAFNLQTVDEIEKGYLTYKQSQKKYGIQDRSSFDLVT